VELHDFARNVRLERTVVVGQIGQYVFGHNLSTPLSVTWMAGTAGLRAFSKKRALGIPVQAQALLPNISR
jgi:hypothetical protein